MFNVLVNTDFQTESISNYLETKLLVFRGGDSRFGKLKWEDPRLM